MSFDLVVFSPVHAPRDLDEFLDWFDQITDWDDEKRYDRPEVATPALRAWLSEMFKVFLPMGIDDAEDENEDLEDESSLGWAEYCIAEHLVYVAFAWSAADEAYQLAGELAQKHGLGLFNVSAEPAEIFRPDVMANEP